MLSKSQIKLIRSLHQKKYRNIEGLFIAEGVKVVNELLNSSIVCQQLFCTNDFIIEKANSNHQIISENELKKISNLKSPNKVLGLFKIPEQNEPINKGLIVALDAIKDPGNLGTIIRLCDWFGVRQLICSNETVDCYNAKVVQSTMGSLVRVAITYLDLETFIKNTSLLAYGAFLEGESVYELEFPENTILVIGGESQGISREVKEVISKKITIPRFVETQTTESLNAAMATAILLNEFKRN